jgi:hypothetical protein
MPDPHTDRIWIALLVVIVSCNDNRMNRISDPKRLCANIAFAATVIVALGIRSPSGNNKDARNAGERRGSQHCQKISRTDHYVLHLFVCWAAACRYRSSEISVV